jgi:hypothetical protein
MAELRRSKRPERVPRERPKRAEQTRPRSLREKARAMAESLFVDVLEEASQKKTQKTETHEKQMTDWQRFQLAVETDYWFTICFLSDIQKMAFLKETGWGHFYGQWEGGRFLPMPTEQPPRIFEMPKRRPRPPRRPRLARGEDSFLPDPLGGIVPLDDIEADPLVELEAVLAACTRYEREPIQDYWEPVKSPHFAPVLFQCIDHKEKFLSEAGWIHLGDKYLDGLQLAKLFQIELPEAEYPIPPPAPEDERYLNGYWLAQLHGIDIPRIRLSNKRTYKDPEWKRLSFIDPAV